jgi:hypothetical protein
VDVAKKRKPAGAGCIRSCPGRFSFTDESRRTSYDQHRGAAMKIIAQEGVGI